MDEKQSHKHCPMRITLIVSAFVVFITTCVFNSLPGVPNNGVFLSNVGAISDKYNVDITPAGWAFSIWGIIYCWQAAWLVFAIVTIFIKNDSGYWYLVPIIPVPTFIVYIVNNLLNITWMFLWDREQMIAACCILALMVVTLQIPLIFSYRNLDSVASHFLQAGQLSAIRSVQILVHNGICVYLGWVTVATLLNFDIVLVGVAGVAMETGGTVALSILLFDILLLITLENFIFEKFMRYSFAQYLGILMGLGGSLAKNYMVYSQRNTIFTLVLLGLAICGLILKISLCIYRVIKHPLYTKSGSVTVLPLDNEKTV